jgi:hypothetical protein
MPGLSGRRFACAFLVAGLALGASITPAVSRAGEQPVQLSAHPAGRPGGYFDLVVRPGERRHLKVVLGNHGARAIAARTYAADVYTIINGGFGARLRGTPATGTTRWLDYQPRILQLPAGKAIERTFTLTVPKGTAPGEYISSVVVENDKPVKGRGAVAIDQVVRQAVTVAVRVPGALRPALAIGNARHSVVAGRSVVGVDVRNTGNARLKPRGQLVLGDSRRQVVSRAAVTMDSFYANTATQVEVTLAKTLQPDRYTVDLSLKDAERGGSANAQYLPLVVTKPRVATGSTGPGSRLTEVLQSTPVGVSAYAIAGTAALALSAAAGGLLLLLPLRRRRAGRPSEHSEVARMQGAGRGD